MSIIGKFLAKIRREKVPKKINDEIFQKIFPHLNECENHGYPFSNDSELAEAGTASFISAGNTLIEIERAVRKMPDAQGAAFRYIVARELNEHMAVYLKFAQEREYPPESESDLRFAARRLQPA